MTSEGNSALLPANVDRRPPLLLPLHVFLFVLYNKSLNDWSLGKRFILFPSNLNEFPQLRLGETLRFSGNKMNCFPRDQSLSVEQMHWMNRLSAGNNFSLVTGHMSFQIFLLVGHLTNWTGHNLLTDNTLKKRTQDLLVRCSVIVSDHNVKLAGHFQNLVGQCR